MTAAGWVSVAEAAEQLGCHRRTVYDGVADGTIPGRRVGRRVLIPAWWLAGNDLRPARAAAPAETGTVLTIARDDELGGRGEA